jgi:FkbH-like protein
MTERVRLLIWDLDDTFWRGTLTEGGVAFVEAHERIAIELARRGIVSSICSKNDLDAVKAILVERGLWDYFVLQSVDWGPKGPRIRDLIETLGLRAATVMFVDDNPLNLEEAKRFNPELQTRGPEFIAEILADPLFAGKDDRELTRLKQYKALELRRVEQRAAADDGIAFLRDSAIEVSLEPDVEAHLDRFIELINRTNQLNFTKKRLPEDPETARAEALRLLGMYKYQAALVSVRDKYGDHGFCGAYLHNSEGRRLEHFAFSCRILGLGVERWLYRRLGRPDIKVEGEVLADLDDPAPVDWIRAVPARERSQADAEGPKIGRITARGSCEIGAVVHYFHHSCDDVTGEYHFFRNGGAVWLGHSIFLRHGACGLSPTQLEAAKRIGYVESDFATRLYDPSPNDAHGHLVLLGFGADILYPLVRHRETGLIAPVPHFEQGWDGRDVTKIAEEELPAHFRPEARETMRHLRAEWEFVGLTRPGDLEGLLRFAAMRIPPSAKICLFGLLTRDYVNKDGMTRRAAPNWEELNAAMRAVAADHPHVAFVDMNSLIEDSEIEDRLHFRRRGLFNIYEKVRDAAFAAPREGALTAAF